MSKIKAEVSAGELLDKISILEIKSERVNDSTKLRNIHRELQTLMEVRDHELRDWHQVIDEYVSLKRVNESLWDIEDRIRICESKQEFGQEFIQLARLVYFENDKRAKYKRMINDKLGSEIVEEKHYVNYQTGQDQPQL